MTAISDARRIAERILSDYRVARMQVEGVAWLLRVIEEALAGRGHALPVAPPPRRSPIDLVLCTGMPRSGSTWSFNACISLLRIAHPSAKVVGLYSENIDDALGADSADYRIVKCHTVDTAGRGAIGRGECRSVYTFRDPREAVASAMAFVEISFEDALGSITASLEFLTFQQRFGDVLCIPYTELAEVPRQAIRKIADHLGLLVDEAAIVEADRRSSPEELALVSSDIDNFMPGEVYRDDKYLYHRPTLIHRRHFTGVGARWESVLNEAQVRKIQHETRFWAHLFG